MPIHGAVLSTTFTVTATPVKNSDAECKIVTDETEVEENHPDTRNDDRVEVTLNVIMHDAGEGGTCANTT